MKIREFNQNWDMINLEDGYTETFWIGRRGMRVHLYTVPQLEYTGEDISIEVNLVPVYGGYIPRVFGKMCESNDTLTCREGITPDIITSPDSTFEKGIDNGKMAQLIIDHNETKC